MATPIKWKCDITGCSAEFNNILLAKRHELSHFSPKFAIGDEIGDMKVVGIRVKVHRRNRLAPFKATLYYKVEMPSIFSESVFDMEFTENSLLDEVKKGKVLNGGAPS